jgi:hypothetical protein
MPPWSPGSSSDGPRHRAWRDGARRGLPARISSPGFRSWRSAVCSAASPASVTCSSASAAPATEPLAGATPAGTGCCRAARRDQGRRRRTPGRSWSRVVAQLQQGRVVDAAALLAGTAGEILASTPFPRRAGARCGAPTPSAAQPRAPPAHRRGRQPPRLRQRHRPGRGGAGPAARPVTSRRVLPRPGRGPSLPAQRHPRDRKAPPQLLSASAETASPMHTKALASPPDGAWPTTVRRLDPVPPAEPAPQGERGQQRNGIRTGNAPYRVGRGGLPPRTSRTGTMQPCQRHPLGTWRPHGGPEACCWVPSGSPPRALAALLASSALMPHDPPPPRQPPGVALPTVPAQPAPTAAATTTTPRAPTTSPARSTTPQTPCRRPAAGRPPRPDLPRPAPRPRWVARRQPPRRP